MTKIRLFGALCLLACSPLVGAAGMAFGLKAGTLGAGVELTKGLTPSMSARFGINNFTYETSGTEADVAYDIDMQLQSGAVMVDWHPFGFGMRATGGILYNNNELDMLGRVAASYTIGGTTYTSGQVGTLTGNVTFDNVVPYLGIGWGNAVGKNDTFSLSVDLGIAFQGAPQASLSADGSLASDPTFISNMRAEEAELNNSLDNFEYYPVVAIGVGMQF